MNVDEAVAALARSMPKNKDLPLAIARAVAALRSDGIDVTEKARAIVLGLPSMRAYAPLLMTDEERIDDLYDRLQRAGSDAERSELFRELRKLQKEEADRLVAVAESRTRFQPREAMDAVAEARRLTTQYAAALDDETTKHDD